MRVNWEVEAEEKGRKLGKERERGGGGDVTGNKGLMCK